MTETKKKAGITEELQVVHVGKEKMELAIAGIATVKQVKLLASMTPEHYIQKREGRGGKTFDYVNINYVIAILNAIFGFNWSIEIIDKKIGANQVYVQIRLKVRFGDGTEVCKDAFGGSDIKRAKSNNLVIDIADDLKSAESDGLKKAASMLGIAWDVYSGITKAKNGGEKKEDTPPKTDTAEPFRDILIIMSDSTERIVTKFEALAYFQNIKKAIGDDNNYEILESAGYKKSNQIPDSSIPTMYALMLKFYQEVDDEIPF